MKLLVVCGCLVLSGCAVCERYPIACTMGTAVLVTGIIVVADHTPDHHAAQVPTWQPIAHYSIPISRAH